MSAAGAGVLSLDHLIWKKDREPYPFRSAKWTPYTLSLMRFMIGYMYIQHGAEKLWGYPAGRVDHNFLSLHGFAGLLELPGGSDDARSIHAPGKLHSFGSDGRRVLGAMGAPRLLAQPDRGRIIDISTDNYPPRVRRRSKRN
jgi:hypothetical protein